jgi:uncharacterized membrane protein YciS (DUF1049 family)
MRILSILTIIFIILVASTFAIMNGQVVTVKYYFFGATEKPLSFVLALAFVFGILFGLVANLLSFMKLKFENRRLQRRLRFSEEEINKLRATANDSTTMYRSETHSEPELLETI